ncbi:MAG: HAD-IIIC family phosphatase [Kiritimatiellae bacterium]|nr:HAD-IIIC family phosphatase [Kiritimatiellia bacterium]
MNAVVAERDFLAFAAAALGVDAAALALDSSRDAGAWDSVGHLNLVMELEARWGVKIPLARVPELKTLRDFHAHVPCRPAKALAVDADNTLWRGIVSEDGPDGVVPDADFQRGLLALKARGVFLVLLSKNDPPPGGAISSVFARPDNPLGLSDFAHVGVNWEPKPGNLLAAARALNLAPEHFVFLDDNPHERVQMRAHLPGVMVPDFDAREGTVPATVLEELGKVQFSGVGETREDFLRTDWRPLAATRPDYLASLGLKVRVARATAADVPRLAQMAGKTNQFNATTIRRTAAEFEALLADAGTEVWTFRARDKFGDMGLVCYVVRESSTGRVTDFVVSCRALGRTLEHFAAQKLGFRTFDFVPTAKNAPARAFLDALRSGDVRTFYEEEA